MVTIVICFLFIQISPLKNKNSHVEAGVVWVRCPEALSVDRPAPDLAAGTVIVTHPAGTRTHRVDPAWSRAAVDAELQTWGVDPGSTLWLPEPDAEDRVHQLLKETR